MQWISAVSDDWWVADAGWWRMRSKPFCLRETWRERKKGREQTHLLLAERKDGGERFLTVAHAAKPLRNVREVHSLQSILDHLVGDAVSAGATREFRNTSAR